MRAVVRGARAVWLYWLEGLSLDARLGVRMLVKHRRLTLVGGVAMTVATRQLRPSGQRSG